MLAGAPQASGMVVDRLGRGDPGRAGRAVAGDLERAVVEVVEPEQSWAEIDNRPAHTNLCGRLRQHRSAVDGGE